MNSPRRLVLPVLLALPVLALASVSRAVPQDDESEREALEEAFSELLTGAQLTGWFTDDTRPDAPPSKDTYTISRAEKADGDKWLIESLIGETGVKIPLYIDVKWAGDTPVMTLDDFPVPQMGSFDARVLFHGQSYAGVWRGKDHGGEMAGRIERASAAGEAGAPK
jgi:hypothetical protein